MEKFKLNWKSNGTATVEAENKEQAVELFREDPVYFVSVSKIAESIITENKKIITITCKKYDQLFEKATQLDCLEAYGVDNWSGYEDAMRQAQNELDQLKA